MGNWSFLPSFPHQSFLKISSYTWIVLTWALYIGRGLESKSRHARSGIEWPRVGQNYMRSAGRAAIPAHVEGVNYNTQCSHWRMSAVQCGTNRAYIGAWLTIHAPQPTKLSIGAWHFRLTLSLYYNTRLDFSRWSADSHLPAWFSLCIQDIREMNL